MVLESLGGTPLLGGSLALLGLSVLHLAVVVEREDLVAPVDYGSCDKNDLLIHGIEPSVALGRVALCVAKPSNFMVFGELLSGNFFGVFRVNAPL